MILLKRQGLGLGYVVDISHKGIYNRYIQLGGYYYDAYKSF